MGVRRAHDVSVCLTVEVKVVAELPLATDEAMVLYAWNGLTDTKFHESPPTALLIDLRDLPTRRRLLVRVINIELCSFDLVDVT